MVPSYIFAGVGGYYASKQGGLAGVFRGAADGSDWKHALSEIEAFSVFLHPRDPNLVFAGTTDGVYRSTDRGQNFRRADFPDRGVQVWSFLHDDADPKWILAGGSPVSIYRSEDGGASWKRMPDPQLPAHAKMPFSCRVMRFASHPRRRGEIFAVLEVSGVMRGGSPRLPKNPALAVGTRRDQEHALGRGEPRQERVHDLHVGHLREGLHDHDRLQGRSRPPRAARSGGQGRRTTAT